MEQPYLRPASSCVWNLDAGWILQNPRYRYEAPIVWCLITATLFPLLAIYIRHRNAPNIKLRSPYLTIISATGGYLSATILLSEQWFRVTWAGHTGRFPVSTGVAGVYVLAMNLTWFVFLIAFFASYPLRALRLLLVFRRQLLCLNQGDPYEDGTRSLSPRPRRHRRFRRASRFSSVARWLYVHILGNGFSEAKFIMFLFVILLTTILAGLFPPPGFRRLFVTECMAGDTDTFTNTVYIGIYGTILVILAIALVLLRNVKDEFTINSELRAVIAGTFVFVVPWAIMSYLESVRPGHFAFSPSWFLVACTVYCYIVSVGWPLYRLIRSDVLVSDLLEQSTMEVTLDRVLEDPEARELFREFLQGALSAELLSFHEAATHFKEVVAARGFEDDRLVRAAREIVDTFLLQHSPIQISIPDAAVETCLSTLRALEASPTPGIDRQLLVSIFDRPLYEVNQLLWIDCFTGFRESRQFEKARDILNRVDTAAAQEVEKMMTDDRPLRPTRSPRR